MSERGAFRGRGGGGRGDHRGGRGGGGGRGGAQGGNAAGQQQTERPKKENILDLSKYMDKRITVKFNGGREGKIHTPHNSMTALDCICIDVHLPAVH